MWFGAGRGARNAVVALIGSGVGACVVADGRPYGGAASSAGEWGHTDRAGQAGARCRCGSLGCLEAYVGAEALLDRWREAGGTRRRAPTRRRRWPRCSPPPIRRRAPRRTRSPSPCWRRPRSTWAPGIADLINLFQPERILIGGWAGLLLGPRFLPAVRRTAPPTRCAIPAAADHHRTRPARPRRGHRRRGDPAPGRLLRPRRPARRARADGPVTGVAGGPGGAGAALTSVPPGGERPGRGSCFGRGRRGTRLRSGGGPPGGGHAVPIRTTNGVRRERRPSASPR